jgi:murein DD-endopeptidase MepM/ murein hydrolase activator NlpD
MAQGIPRLEMDAPNMRAIPRFDPFAAIPVTPVDDSISQVHQQVAQSLSGITDMVDKIWDTKVKQEAILAGETAGADPNFQAGNLPAADSWTVAGQAYREGAASSFLSRLELDRADHFGKAVMDYTQVPDAEKDPLAFAQNLHQYVDETAKGLPADMRLDYQKQAYAKMLPLAQTALTEKVNYQQKQMVLEQDAAYKDLLMQAKEKAYPKTQAEQVDYDTTLVQLNAAIDANQQWGPEQKKFAKHQALVDIQTATVRMMQAEEKAAEDLKKQSVEQRSQTYQNLFSGTDTGQRLSFLQRFENTPHDKLGFGSLEEKNSTFNILKAEYDHGLFVNEEETRKLSDAEKIQKAFVGKELNDAVADGKSSPAAIIQAQKNGIITPEKAGSLLYTLQSVQKKHAAENAKVSAIKNGAAIDFTDDKQVKLLEKAQQQLLDGQQGSYEVRWPVNAPISSQYGVARPGHSHGGVDIAGKLGSAVMAPVSGEVVLVDTSGKGPSQGFGTVVHIQGADGRLHKLAHMYPQDIMVKPGDRVAAGQRVGKVGSAGRSTGPHMHYEVWEGDKRINPVSVVGKKQVAMDKTQGLEGAIQLAIKSHHAGLLNNTITTGLHGKPDQQVSAANLYLRLKKENVIMGSLSSDDKDYAEQVLQMADKGYQPQQIADKLAVTRDPLKKPQLAVLDQNFDGLFKKKGQIKAEYSPDANLTDNGWFQEKSAITLQQRGALNIEWENYLKEGHRRRNGDVDGAVAFAKEKMAKTWGTTRVGGKPLLMKRPPELMYRMDAENISHQLDAVIGVKRKAYKRVWVEEPEFSNKRWVYPVMGMLPSGELEPVKDDKNKPLIFYPDKSLPGPRQTMVNNKRAEAAKRGPVEVYNSGYPFSMVGK